MANTKPNDLARLTSRGWVSLAGFARIIGVSYPTAHKMHKEGKIRTVQVGSVWRVYAEEAKRFMEEGNFTSTGSSTANGEGP